MPTVRLSSPSPTLGVLGFSVEQEALYRLVLRHSGATVADLASLAGAEPGRVREHVVRFAGVGLVDLQDDVVVALPPADAVARLVTDEGRRLRSRAEQLEAVRTLVPTLSAEHLAATAPRGEPVGLELVDGGDIAQLVRSLSVASTGDLLWLRPDQWRDSTGSEVDDWVRDLLRSGRRSRAIYPARVLEQAPDVVRRRAEAGEHVRVLAEVPTRLAVLGTSAALVPELVGDAGDRRLVVRQPFLVGALTLLFEQLWERAMSVSGLDGRRDDGGATDRRLLLAQLARGAKDEQIARALGLSVRTVRRRVAELVDELGADSRFQAGVESVRRGWV